jgi:hypothetical protein
MTDAITIDNLYNSALSLGELVGYQELASDLLAKTPDPKVASERLVKLTVVRSSCTSICNLFTGESYIPVNTKLSFCETVGTAGLQLRMILTIAYMAGYNPTDEEVKTFLSGYCASTLICGASRSCMTKFGFNTATYLISSIPGKSLTKVNKTFGHRVFTKNGHTSDIRLLGLACVGGMIANTMLDASSTYAIGRAAIRVFFDKDTPIITAQVVN